jgi:hypothetical protein
MVLKLRRFGIDQKDLESVEMWCWRRIIWTGHMRSEAYHKVKDERNILPTIKRKKAHWTGYMMRKNCLLKHIIEGKIEWTRDKEEA